MTEQNYNFTFQRFENLNSLPKELQELFKAAVKATDLAYAPYSNFYVGAAFQMAKAGVLVGSNQENPAYPRYKDEDCYTVSGTNGSLAIPSMRLKYFGSDEERSWWKPFQQEQIVYERCDPLQEQLNHFVKVIEGSEEPRVTAFDGLQNLKIIEAIDKSAELGTLILD